MSDAKEVERIVDYEPDIERTLEFITDARRYAGEMAKLIPEDARTDISLQSLAEIKSIAEKGFTVADAACDIVYAISGCPGLTSGQRDTLARATRLVNTAHDLLDALLTIAEDMVVSDGA